MGKPGRLANMEREEEGTGDSCSLCASWYSPLFALMHYISVFLCINQWKDKCCFKFSPYSSSTTEFLVFPGNLMFFGLLNIDATFLSKQQSWQSDGGKWKTGTQVRIGCQRIEAGTRRRKDMVGSLRRPDTPGTDTSERSSTCLGPESRATCQPTSFSFQWNPQKAITKDHPSWHHP